jgi:chorismate synthase
VGVATGVEVGAGVAVAIWVGVEVVAAVAAVGDGRDGVRVEEAGGIEVGVLPGEEAQAVKRLRHTKSRHKLNHSLLNHLFFI